MEETSDAVFPNVVHRNTSIHKSQWRAAASRYTSDASGGSGLVGTIQLLMISLSGFSRKSGVIT
jgi:hypothetical protein